MKEIKNDKAEWGWPVTICASIFLVVGMFSECEARGYESKAETKIESEEGRQQSEEDLEEIAFYIQEIQEGDSVYQRINGRSYRENNDISLGELRYLGILYYDFEHEIQEGELIVNEVIAQDCMEIFRSLYEAEYEIASVRLIDDFWAGDGDASDTASIEANNTSAFCYRMTTSGASLSNHALGCAIDINPRQNPYFSYTGEEAVWYHEGDEDYFERDTGKEHMITDDDLCCQLFKEYGFTWGGDWENPKDYQHFERKP